MSAVLIPLAALAFIGICLFLTIWLVFGNAPILPPIQV